MTTSSTTTPKKNILFTYNEHTTMKQRTLLSTLAASFSSEEYQTHQLALTGVRPAAVFQKFTKPLKFNLFLLFSLNCLGFDLLSLSEEPLYNTLWTPCVTLLTKPVDFFYPLLTKEWNLNITVLCPEGTNLDALRRCCPDLSDVRIVPDPLLNPAPLCTILHELADRY